MSQSDPPPGNPFAGGGYPGLPEPGPERDSAGLGMLAALVAALVAGTIHGVVAGQIEIEIGWAAFGVGFLSGFMAGKAGGSNPFLMAAAGVFSIGGVYFGQLLAFAIINSKDLYIPVTEMFLQHFDLVTDSWDESKSLVRLLFFALAAAGAAAGVHKGGAR
ncbi:hypothetical protein [Streptomyces sp.]|uniref:hypothetical protein n=1 Tax=Streptomyces sp. TaxID=1931 RepID=UPI002F958910